MFYNIYQLWVIYTIILQLHGVYVAYSFLMWSFATSFTYLAYMLTFVYVAQPVEQLEDKKDNKLDELD